MALRSVANELAWTRAAVPVSRRVGKAVVRNRVRRRIREALRSLSVREGFDIVISPRPPAANSDYWHLRAELILLLTRARLLLDPPAS
jgi:ribonuclease P protein component